MNAPQHPQPPLQALRRLAEFLHQSGSRLSPEQAATLAIDEWIAAAQGRFTNLAPTPSRGYQWKCVFLPEGTELRMSHGGDSHFARVVGDDIVCQGQRVSPRQMTIMIAGDGHNAWRDLWLRLPNDLRWRQADALRREVEKQDAPVPVSPLDAMNAAAACMSETLKSAVALMQHANLGALAQFERRLDHARRNNDHLADVCSFD